MVLSLSLSKKPDKIDSDSERWKEHESVCGFPRCTTIRRFLVFLVRFSCSHFHKVLVRYRYRDSLSLSILSGLFDIDSDIDSDSDSDSDIDSERTTITGCGLAALGHHRVDR